MPSSICLSLAAGNPDGTCTSVHTHFSRADVATAQAQAQARTNTRGINTWRARISQKSRAELPPSPWGLVSTVAVAYVRLGQPRFCGHPDSLRVIIRRRRSGILLTITIPPSTVGN
jgi:hypothetical protein